MAEVYHALMFNLHQPSGNLEQLLEQDEWQAKEILYALDRMPRLLWGWEDVARVHLALSGTLLETLSNPDFQNRVYGIVKCGDFLWYLQNRQLFDILGTAYYHPVLPLIPEEDWEPQLRRWQGTANHIFWRTDFHGFWPPEMGFCMELIPLLKRLGYRYALVDCENLEPLTPMSWTELRYRPHIARYQGEEIVVIPRDRTLSDSQESGMDCGWFMHEVHERVKNCEFPPLVTTCSDGENGGWFRNISEKGNFWGVFYLPLLEKARRGETEIRPIFIHDYLDKFGTYGEVKVRAAAWNTGWHNGIGFTQWTGSPLQKDALRRLKAVSEDVRKVRYEQAQQLFPNPAIERLLEESYWRVLRAETSCHFYWGEEWVHRATADLDDALRYLGRALAEKHHQAVSEDPEAPSEIDDSVV